MKEHPIIMSGNHPKLVLDGLKTMTRRVIKLLPLEPNKYAFVGLKDDLGYRESEGKLWAGFQRHESLSTIYYPCPYGQVGDRLWVRETWYSTPNKKEIYGYKANGEIPHGVGYRVIPSIHMPRWASRITLEITEIRVERVQEISEVDAKAEGAMQSIFDIPDYEIGDNSQVGEAYLIVAFKGLWDSLNTKRGYGWDTNPWVWCISFKVV